MARIVRRFFQIIEDYEVAITFAQANDAEDARYFLG